MRKKWTIFWTVFLLSLIFLTVIDLRSIDFYERGIVVDDQKKNINFVTHNDSTDHLKLSFSKDFVFTQKSYVRDKMLSGKKTVLVDEHILKTRLLIPDTDISIDLRITARYFDNADALLFFRFFSEKGFDQDLFFALDFPLAIFEEAKIKTLNYSCFLKPTEMDKMESSMLEVVLTEKASYFPSSLNYIETISPYGLVNGSFLLGPGAVFKNKEVRLRELQGSDLNPLIQLSKEKQRMKVSIPVKIKAYQYQENWFFYSPKRLLDYDNEETLKNMLAADFTLKKKLSMDGIYHIASSLFYEGASDETYDYYYNYAMWEGRRFMNLHQKYPEQSLFYNFFVNSVYTTVKSAHRYGVWVSDVRSKYLWSTYQIPEGYIDTRYCTDAGFFLLQVYNTFQIPDALSAGEKFGDFLHQKILSREGISTGPDGFFCFDYYLLDQDFPTHASLNHILSEMNYLFELYLSTYKKSYLDTAEFMLKALHETGNRWIRDQEYGRFRYDLWYGVFPEDNGDLAFKLHDYTKDLTYYDLLQSQRHIKTIYNKSDPVLDLLIKSKLKFFQREGIKVRE
jgi:hypothetical protein